MPFRFPLTAVLKYRKNLEHREYVVLGRVHQEIARVESLLEQCEEKRREAARSREKDTARGIVSVHLQDAYERERSLENLRDELQLKRQELQMKRLQCLKAYELARQKREVLEELRNRQLQAYILDQSRREQRQIDDLYLSRRKRDN